MAWCLTKDQEVKFREALVSKKINPFELIDMTSDQRRTLFEKYVDGENAININSLYESKLLLKNQQQGFRTWAKRIIGMSPTIKRDLSSKIERLDEIGVLDPKDLQDFKEDLARTRLGFNITFEEAKTINELSAERVESKEKLESFYEKNPSRKDWVKNPVRLEYGLKQVALENYVKDLKLKAEGQKVSIKEDPIRAIINPIKESPGFFNNLFKSLMASIDNSFFGRQGIKNLYGSPSQKRIWARNFVKSFSDMSAEIRKKKIDGFKPMDFIRADIYSRPNALNGKYKAGNYQLGVLTEEVFPTSLPEKIPGLGRLFRASETAFSGGALRIRADLADLLISKMDIQGINSLDPKQARGPGHLVGSLTGRGSLGKATTMAKELNFILWSARFFKGNIDTLTAHQFDPQATKFTKKEARKNLVSVVAHVVGIIMLAKFLDPESVDEDPRSTNFGRIKIFGHWIDITGGMRTIATMASRVVPTYRNGEWGFWSKSSTGKWTNLTAGKFGQRDAVDIIMDTIFLNRLAPVASVLRDMYRGEMFGGEPFDIKKSIINSATPLSIQNVLEVKDESFENILGVAISEFFGLGVSTYKFKDNWERKTSKEMKQFKEQVGDQKFKDANESYNRAYNAWIEEDEEDSKYKELSEEGKSSLKSSAKSAIKKKILDEYGFDRTKKPETVEELKEKEQIKLLKPVSSLIEGVKDVIAKIDLVPEVFAAEDNPIVNIEIKGDNVKTTFKNGSTQSASIFFDDSFIEGIGKLFHDVGTALNAPELNISELLGFETREEQIAKLMKYKTEVLDKSENIITEIKKVKTEVHVSTKGVVKKAINVFGGKGAPLHKYEHVIENAIDKYDLFKNNPYLIPVIAHLETSSGRNITRPNNLINYGIRIKKINELFERVGIEDALRRSLKEIGSTGSTYKKFRTGKPLTDEEILEFGSKYEPENLDYPKNLLNGIREIEKKLGKKLANR